VPLTHQEQQQQQQQAHQHQHQCQQQVLGCCLVLLRWGPAAVPWCLPQLLLAPLSPLVALE
jgi:hypothetical protein